ncbi:MAG: hypothetical protein U1E70_13040 [Acetobacteraceae bacterium]
MHRRHLLAAAIIALTATAATAQTNPPTRIRGTIAALDGNTLTVNSRGGEAIPVTLNDPLTVSALKKVDLASIDQNAYVGIATRTGPDGRMTAIEVLVFPEAARGAGEGHYPWDLEPGSMMTNGTVTGAVSATNGRDLTIRHKDDSKTIAVPAGVPVVTPIPAERADLKPGAQVFMIATKNAEGKLAVSRVTVGKDGVNPPM